MLVLLSLAIVAASGIPFGAYWLVRSRQNRRALEAVAAQAAEQKRQFAQRGLTVAAFVKSFETTGLQIRGVHQFHVAVVGQLVDGRIIAASDQRFVLPMHAEAIEIGIAARITYDPSSPSNFEIYLGYEDAPALSPVAEASETEAAFEVETPLVEYSADQLAVLEELEELGTVARAVVTNFESLSTAPNEEGLLAKLTATVLPVGKPTFPAVFSSALSYERLPRYQPGEQIWVRYDEQDPSRVTIDFTRQGDLGRRAEA